MIFDENANADFDEKPMRRVYISKGFWISKYEATNENYYGVKGDDVEIIFIVNDSKLSMNKELFGKGE